MSDSLDTPEGWAIIAVVAMWDKMWWEQSMRPTKAALTVWLALAAVAQTPVQRTEQASTSAPASVSQKQPVEFGSYVGDDTCRSCHREKSRAYLLTAHHLTSQLADEHTIAGKFSPDANILKTSNPELFFRMDATEKGYFQTAVAGTPPYTTVRAERFDFVIGSGRKGQTYLFWKGDQLFQLPVSYWIELGQWGNSPGYPDGVANFNRRVIPRCLECHTTYFRSLPPPENRYNKTDLVLGISCEKCHGPGREHVERYSSNSKPTLERDVVDPAKLSRDRQIDLCAWCHAGQGQQLFPAFSYLPGEPLDGYIDLPRPDPNAPVDVHGSQVELLKRSRCFQSSSMTCFTCHDVHAPQHDLATFSERCLSCHKGESCGVFRQRGRQIAGNCIDCHMPNQPTALIVSELNGRKVTPKVRNHWIKVYPEVNAP